LGLATPGRPELRFAHRAFCARLILLRADADIFRRVAVGLIEFESIPDRAETAASNRPNSNAALSLAAFNCASMSMRPPRVGIVTNDCPLSGQQKRVRYSLLLELRKAGDAQELSRRPQERAPTRIPREALSHATAAQAGYSQLETFRSARFGSPEMFTLTKFNPDLPASRDRKYAHSWL
jgi:hypothetical protein